MAATRAPKSPATAASDHPGAAQTPGAATTPGAVAVTGSRAVALPADVAAELAGYAKDEAAKERPTLSKISLKSGMMSYQGQPVPGDAMDVVILACAHRNTWYSGSYDPDNIVNPSCFAISSTGDDMVPHENVAEPVHATCTGCPKNEWGTALRDGKPTRGKACKEGRRMLIVPAGAVASVEAFKTAEMAVVDVPVTSVGNYGNYVNTLNAAVQRPIWAVITKLKVVRDMRTQFKLTFEPMSTINDVDLIRAIRARLDDAMRVAMIPHDESALAGEKKEPDPKAAAKTAKFKQGAARA